MNNIKLELLCVLAEHAEWLSSAGRKGNQLVARGLNFGDLNLVGKNFSECALAEENFSKAT